MIDAELNDWSQWLIIFFDLHDVISLDTDLSIIFVMRSRQFLSLRLFWFCSHIPKNTSVIPPHSCCVEGQNEHSWCNMKTLCCLFICTALITWHHFKLWGSSWGNYLGFVNSELSHIMDLVWMKRSLYQVTPRAYELHYLLGGTVPAENVLTDTEPPSSFVKEKGFLIRSENGFAAFWLLW